MLSMPAKTVLARVSDEHIALLIGCAATGIGYWARRASHDPVAKTLRVADVGNHTGETQLSYESLRQSLATLAASGDLPDWQIVELWDDDLGFDASVADKVVQTALFGRLTYG